MNALRKAANTEPGAGISYEQFEAALKRDPALPRPSLRRLAEGEGSPSVDRAFTMRRVHGFCLSGYSRIIRLPTMSWRAAPYSLSQGCR